jgi:hypothetical protein
MPPKKVIRMATRGGAEILGQPEIGQIKPGMAADLAVFRLDRLDFAGAMTDPAHAVLFCGSAPRAEYTIVAGKVLVEKGELVGIDEKAVFHQANDLTADLLRKAGGLGAGMQQLRQAAARERRAPIYWWLLLMAVSGGALVGMVHAHSRPGAFFVAVLLAAAWRAPLVALHSLAAPPRAKKPAPAPGTGGFHDWLAQARMLGRVLLYYQDNPDLPPDLQQEIRAAREDLRDVLRAHPLRDDLERACGRVRAGAIRSVKDWFAREYRRDIRELANEYEQAAAAGMDPDKRMARPAAGRGKSRGRDEPQLHAPDAGARAPGLRRRLRLAGRAGRGRRSGTPFARRSGRDAGDRMERFLGAVAAGHRAAARAGAAGPRGCAARAGTAAGGGIGGRRRVRAGARRYRHPHGKRYRRVRVRRKHRRHHRHFWSRGPSLADVFVSFGQWLRYSIRAWMLYR